MDPTTAASTGRSKTLEYYFQKAAANSESSPSSSTKPRITITKPEPWTRRKVGKLCKKQVAANLDEDGLEIIEVPSKSQDRMNAQMLVIQ